MKERGVYKSSNEKVSDWLQLPICYNHHQGRNGVHTIGVREWEDRFGEQAMYVDLLSDLLGVDLWEKARDKPQRTYKRPTKILPREEL